MADQLLEGMQNTVPVSPQAIAIMCQYPFAKIRSDMAYGEYNQYKVNWYTFNRVWAYNYTVRALNASSNDAKYSYYIFNDVYEHASYITGQNLHAALYPSAAAAGAFNNIP